MWQFHLLVIRDSIPRSRGRTAKLEWSVRHVFDAILDAVIILIAIGSTIGIIGATIVCWLHRQQIKVELFMRRFSRREGQFVSANCSTPPPARAIAWSAVDDPSFPHQSMREVVGILWRAAVSSRFNLFQPNRLVVMLRRSDNIASRNSLKKVLPPPSSTADVFMRSRILAVLAVVVMAIAFAVTYSRHHFTFVPPPIVNPPSYEIEANATALTLTIDAQRYRGTHGRYPEHSRFWNEMGGKICNPLNGSSAIVASQRDLDARDIGWVYDEKDGVVYAGGIVTGTTRPAP
jgi:hypothetical protein